MVGGKFTWAAAVGELVFMTPTATLWALGVRGKRSGNDMFERGLLRAVCNETEGNAMLLVGGAHYAGILLSSIWHSQMCQRVGRPSSCTCMCSSVENMYLVESNILGIDGP